MRERDGTSRPTSEVESPTPGRTPRSEKAPTPTGRIFTPEERLLLLDVWLRSEMAAPRFGELIGLSAHSLYQWRKAFEQDGPAGLEDRPRGQKKGSSRLPEPTQRAILMLKRSHPEWGCDRLHQMLLRSRGYTASPGAIQRLLLEQGYEVVHEPTRPHAPPKVQRFVRARPNQLWQTDLFTFLLKRENRRLYLIVFLDDHSRYVVSYSLAASSSGSLAREALEHGIANYGPPEEVLTDNYGPEMTSRALDAWAYQRGVRLDFIRPGKPIENAFVESFNGKFRDECLNEHWLTSLQDARFVIECWRRDYNLNRPHKSRASSRPVNTPNDSRISRRLRRPRIHGSRKVEVRAILSL